MLQITSDRFSHKLASEAYNYVDVLASITHVLFPGM